VDRKIVRSLQKIVGRQNVLTAPADVLLYSYDASTAVGTPDAVVLPASTDEVARVVKVCAERGIPFVPRGAGTNLSGGSVPLHGGVVIVLSRLNRTLEIDLDDQIAVVQPGVVNLDLQKTLAGYGMQFCPDPASQKVSTVGGNVAENAGGPHCLKYGVTVNHVLGLTVVLPSGEIRRFGGKVLDTPGYDLVGAFIGSEGTLGIVTEMVLRLRPLPEDAQIVLVIFETLEAAGESVSRIIAAGMMPAAMEIMDRQTIAAVEASFPSGLPLDVEAVLLIELDGLKDSLDRQAEQCAAICRELKARSVAIGRTPEERDKLWTARKSAFGATARLSPAMLVNDATVPRTKIPEVLRKIQEIERRHGVRIAKVFHAGDGNLHSNILFERSDPEDFKRAEAATAEIFKVCVEAGGTLTGEHGVGAEKVKFMHLLYSPADLEAQRKLKSVFDPRGLANPGKILPAPNPAEGPEPSAVRAEA
jgi:glycolate oxidase subunit GlcD